MFHTIVVRLIFTGLVTLVVSPQGGGSKALLLDSRTHEANVVMLEGSCAESKAVCGGAGPAPLFRSLEGAETATLRIKSLPTDRPPERARGREKNGGVFASVLPQGTNEVPDATWIVSIGNGEKPDLGGSEATFEIPKLAKLSNCHLVHRYQAPGDPNVLCKDYRERFSEAEVFLFQFVHPTGDCCGPRKTCRPVDDLETQAISDAFMVEFTLTDKHRIELELDLDGGLETLRLLPRPLGDHLGAVTLVVMNQPPNDPNLDEDDPHCHFRKHFSVGGDLEFVPMRVRNKEITMIPGVCEPYFECLAALGLDFDKQAPHFLTQCDVATYP